MNALFRYANKVGWLNVTLAVLLGLFIGFSPTVTLAQTTCPTCDGGTVTVDENVTVNFNTNPPTYTGEPDLLPYFSYDNSGLTADTWVAIFDVGPRRLLVTNGATITVNTVGSGNNQYAPGIEIWSTCDLEVEAGGHIVVQSLNRKAGDIFIQVDGDITVNGEVRNEVTGTNGMPGDITIESCCGDITVGTTGRIYDLGIDPGGGDINILTCCPCRSGDIVINGLVMAFAHAHADNLEETRPHINIVSIDGTVTINANTTEPLEDEYSMGGGRYDLYGGLLSWVRDNQALGSIKVQALKDITVNGHGADPTGPRTTFAAIAVVAGTSAPPSSTVPAGTVDVRSEEGSIVGNDRAFQVSPGSINALIRLWAAQDITLSRPGATSSFNPVVDVSYYGTLARKGGTNELRAYQGGITVNTPASVLATGNGVANNGTNLFTYCTIYTNTGTVTPAPTTNSDCTDLAPDGLFADCSYFDGVCDCPGGSITIVKEVLGTPPTDAWEYTSTVLGFENFTLPAGGGSITFEVLPGAYTFEETPKSGYTVTPENPKTLTLVEECEELTYTFINTQSLGCFWCNKGSVLSQVDQNMGNRCFVPDIFVDVTLPHDPVNQDSIGTGGPATGSIQAAIDYINGPDWPSHDPTPGDGEIFIGVNSTDCEDTPTFECAARSRVLAGDTPFGVENVVITNTRPERLNVFGCSVSLHAEDPDKPVITIENGVGKVTVMDIHVSGSHVAGYFVQSNADLVVVKNSRSIGASGIGYWIVDDDVEITGAQEVSNNDIGILVEGSNVKLRTNNDINSNGIGIKITGDKNESNGNDVGENGKPNGIGIVVEGKANLLHGDLVIYNTTDGIVITGSGTSLADGNFVTDEDAQHNGDDGIVVSGNYNTADRNRQVKFNGGDGIEVSGDRNLLNENTAEENGGHGINLSGNSNTLKKNEVVDNGGGGIHVTGDSNVLNENTAEDNTLNGIKADAADGASNNDLKKNQAKNNSLQGIRACGQNDLGDNTGSGNGVNPQVDFVCAPPAPAKFFVSDSGDDEVYTYDAAGNLVGSFDTGSDGSGDPFGLDVVGTGTDVYVLDKSDKRVYKYNDSGSLQGISRLLVQQGGSSLSSPGGLAIDGNEMWIVDRGRAKILRYSLSDAFGVGGNLKAAQEIALHSNNSRAEGLTLDGMYVYVLDQSKKQFYRYPRAGGAATASRVMVQVSGSSLSSPNGASLEGASMWVVDAGRDKALSYDLSALYSGSGNLKAASEFALDNQNGDAQGLGLIAGSPKVSGDPSVELEMTMLPIPHETSLLGSYPNPFNPTTTIQFQLSESDRVTLKVYDILGREVRTLMDGEVKDAGYHAVIWNARDGGGKSLPSGVYFIRLQTSRLSEIHKTMLLK
jgi:parallel beta-helix repeat protein